MKSVGTTRKNMRNEDFDRMHLDLIGHMQAEEDIFDPLLETTTSDLIREALREHQIVRSDLRNLGDLWTKEAVFTQKLQKLEHDIMHHVEEEESKIFDTARKVLAMDQLQDMGQLFEQEKHVTAKKGLAAAQQADTST
jgi:hemerythrin-like domain-containing protein